MLNSGTGSVSCPNRRSGAGEVHAEMRVLYRLFFRGCVERLDVNVAGRLLVEELCHDLGDRDCQKRAKRAVGLALLEAPDAVLVDFNGVLVVVGHSSISSPQYTQTVLPSLMV